MPKQQYLTESEIRAGLLNRANEFCTLTGTSRSALGKAITNDSTLFADIEAERNFTISLYTKVMVWLTEHWPSAKEIAKREEAKAKKQSA